MNLFDMMKGLNNDTKTNEAVTITTAPTEVHTTAPAVENTTVPTEVHTIAPAVENATVPTEVHTTAPAVENTTVPTEVHTTAPAVENATVPTEVHTTAPAVENATVPTEVHTTASAVENTTVVTTESTKTDDFTLSEVNSEDKYADIFAALGKEEAIEENTAVIDTKESTQKKEETNNFSVNTATIIRYYGEVIPITQYFSLEELTNGIVKKGKATPINDEDVRKRLEQDYPELIKSHSSIICIPKKNILVPSIIAKKKGAEPLSNNGSLFYKKIPFELLFKFIEISLFFKSINKEVHSDIYYNYDTQQYILDTPIQSISTYNVVVTEDPLVTLERIGYNCKKVMEIHSHHILLASPSAQDNASERVPGMLYGIVGELEYGWPKVFIREYIKEDSWKQMGMAAVFTSPFPTLSNIECASLLKTCSIKKDII